MALLSEAIRLRREELGLDQSELALRLGVGQQTVSRWETGSGLPRRERLPQLADALEFDPSHLLRLAGYLPQGEEESARIAFRAAYERAEEFSEDELVLFSTGCGPSCVDVVASERPARGRRRLPDQS